MMAQSSAWWAIFRSRSQVRETPKSDYKSISKRSSASNDQSGGCEEVKCAPRLRLSLSGNAIFGVKEAPCLSCWDKRLKVRKQEKDEVKYKGCSARKRLSVFFWGEWTTHHSSAVPLATALPAQHLNMRTLTSLLISVPPIHPPFPHFSIPTPPSSLECSFYPPPHSRNPPAPYPSSAPLALFSSPSFSV